MVFAEASGSKEEEGEQPYKLSRKQIVSHFGMRMNNGGA